MIYRMLARLNTAAHIAYIVFVLLGAFLVLRWPALLPLHIAAVGWAICTLVFDFGCPLTPMEKTFLRKSGIEPYQEGFLQHYVFRTTQSPEAARRSYAILGASVFALNVVLYTAMAAIRG